MRVLTVCYEYPPIGGGGGRVAKAVAEGLAARGHEVRVQTAALGFRSVREVSAGVEVFRTASGRRLPDTCSVREMGQFLATSFWPMLRHIRAWRPDVVHAHFAVPTGLLTWALHRLTRVPYVLTAHLGDVPGGVPEQTDKLFRLVGPVAQRVWRDAAGATAVSGFVQELAEQAYGRDVTRIVNGIDLAGRGVGRRQVGEPQALHEPLQLLFVGRFNPQKNAPLLIDALAQAMAVPWRLTMIGDGPELPAVRERIAQHGLGERVTPAGWRAADEVHAAMGEADVLCMPSWAEGLPVAGIEALKYGLAIAGTDIPGLKDVIAPGENGIAAPLARYAEALQEMLGDRERLLSMRRASWRKAAEFELSRVIDEYERVLARCAQARISR